jgi:phage N-6-adenine-methyltransferase
MLNKGLMTSDKNYWETPQSFYKELDKEFKFDLDVASSDENAKCANHYTIEDDGLLPETVLDACRNDKWTFKSMFKRIELDLSKKKAV